MDTDRTHAHTDANTHAHTPAGGWQQQAEMVREGSIWLHKQDEPTFMWCAPRHAHSMQQDAMGHDRGDNWVGINWTPTPFEYLGICIDHEWQNVCMHVYRPHDPDRVVRDFEG